MNSSVGGGQSTALTINGSGAAALNSTVGASSEWIIGYGAGSPTLSFDATAGGASVFRFGFSFSTFSTLEYALSVTSASGSGTSNSASYQALSGSYADIAFTSFSNFSNINFSDLSELTLSIRNAGSSVGGNVDLTQFETVSVPEPAMGIAMLGLAFFSSCSRMRRRR